MSRHNNTGCGVQSSNHAGGSAALEIGWAVGERLRQRGDLTVRGLYVGSRVSARHVLVSGRVWSDILAQSVTVEGTVRGSIAATERVTLSRTACVVGDIRAPELQVADGAMCSGTWTISPAGREDTGALICAEFEGRLA